MKGEKAHHIRRFYPPQGSSLLEGHLGALPTAWGKVALGRWEGLTARVWLRKAESVLTATDLYVLPG